MSYAVLNAVVLGLCCVFVITAIVIGRRQSDQFTAPVFTAGILTMVIMLATTAIFDSIIIVVGLVDYDPSTLLGMYVGNAPLEDFAYTVAAVMILPTLWILLGSRKEKK